MTTPGTVIYVPTDAGDVPFTVSPLGRTQWADLIHEHPTDDPRWRWNQDTLYPALVAACVTDPVVDLDWAARLVDDPDVGVDLVDLCLRLTEPGSLEWARRRLHTDVRLAAEVAASVRMGISHAEFTSWPDRSQDLALAWIDQTTKVCPGCGVPEADMKKPAAWEPDVRPCWHCDQLETARAAIAESNRHREHVRLVPAGTT